MVKRECHLEVILDVLDIMIEEGRRQNAGSVVKDALGFAERGVSIVQGLTDGDRVSDIDCIRLYVDSRCDSLNSGLLLFQ